MPRVFIPPPLRSLADERESLEIEGKTVREIIRNLDEQFPGMKDRLCEANQLRPEICVAVGSSINPLGMLAKVSEDQEVHFLPIVGGG